MKVNYLILALIMLFFTVQSCNNDNDNGSTTKEITDNDRLAALKTKGAFFEYGYSLDGSFTKTNDFCQLDMLLYPDGKVTYRVTYQVNSTGDCAQVTNVYEGTYIFEKAQQNWVLKLNLDENKDNFPTEFNIIQMEDNKDSNNLVIQSIQLGAVNLDPVAKPFSKAIYFKRDTTKEPGKV